MRSNRHAIIVSANGINKRSGVVQAVYITTRHKNDSMTHVDISTKYVNRIALCEQVTPIDKSRLVEYKGQLTKEQMNEIDKKIAWGLNLTRYFTPENIDKHINKVL